MAEPYLAEIRIMSFAFPPKGWALCNGQTLPINQNLALFALLGTTFGGNGQTNFALPDLRGRVPIHPGSGYTVGQNGGAQSHSLTAQQMPTHSHVLQGSTLAGDATRPNGRLLATEPASTYAPPPATVALAAASVTTVGGSQPHPNMQPYLTISFCIALQGIFPSTN